MAWLLNEELCCVTAGTLDFGHNNSSDFPALDMMANDLFECVKPSTVKELVMTCFKIMPWFLYEGLNETRHFSYDN